MLGKQFSETSQQVPPGVRRGPKPPLEFNAAAIETSGEATLARAYLNYHGASGSVVHKPRGDAAKSSHLCQPRAAGGTAPYVLVQPPRNLGAQTSGGMPVEFSFSRMQDAGFPPAPLIGG